MHQFDHEKVNVYHESLRFVAQATELLERVPKAIAVSNQLDRTSTAIPLNIAEGTGKFTLPDRCRYYDTRVVVSMLVGLIKAVAPDRVYENGVEYAAGWPTEQVKVKE
jgi:hypothetical protein